MCGFFVVFDLPSVEMLIFSLNFDRFDPFQSLERQFYCHNTGCVWLWGGGSLGLLTLHLPASTLHLCWKKMIFLDIFTSCALPDGIVKKTVVAKTGSKYELKKKLYFFEDMASVWRWQTVSLLAPHHPVLRQQSTARRQNMRRRKKRQRKYENKT